MQLRRLIGKHFWSSWGSTSNSRRGHCRAETSRRLTAKKRRYEEEKKTFSVVMNWPDGGLRPPLEDKTIWKNKRHLIRRALVFSRSSCPQLRGAQSGQCRAHKVFPLTRTRQFCRDTLTEQTPFASSILRIFALNRGYVAA